jgi:UDP-glucuronate 4-epimerase
VSILITGSAGFIGSELCLQLLQLGKKVVGIDNHNSYYDPQIKENRLARYLNHPNYKHHRIDLNNKAAIDNIFENYNPYKVVNLAAQAGVRYSIENPTSYIESNIFGFMNILENCRNHKVEHLVYASTSSVYGANTKMPFSENDNTNHPLSIYAASKKSNELMSHAYSYLFKLPTTGLRFFTVYGPWGRPDMALFKFTKNILEEKPIDVFNYGKHTRDFTYIDDIVKGIIKIIDNPATSNKNWNSDQPDPATSNVPWRIYNIGNNKPILLMDYIKALEKTLDKKAIINYLPLQLGDVPDTCADTNNLKINFSYKPSTPVFHGVSNFVTWYKNYYQE